MTTKYKRHTIEAAREALGYLCSGAGAQGGDRRLLSDVIREAEQLRKVVDAWAAWCADEEHGCGGRLFEAAVQAMNEIETEE